MLVLTLRWMGLPILAQLFYIWMYAGKIIKEAINT